MSGGRSEGSTSNWSNDKEEKVYFLNFGCGVLILCLPPSHQCVVKCRVNSFSRGHGQGIKSMADTERQHAMRGCSSDGSTKFLPYFITNNHSVLGSKIMLDCLPESRRGWDSNWPLLFMSADVYHLTDEITRPSSHAKSFCHSGQYGCRHLGGVILGTPKWGTKGYRRKGFLPLFTSISLY